MKISEIKAEVERLTATPIPKIEWEQLMNSLYPTREMNWTENMKYTLVKHMAEEYRKLKGH